MKTVCLHVVSWSISCYTCFCWRWVRAGSTLCASFSLWKACLSGHPQHHLFFSLSRSESSRVLEAKSLLSSLLLELLRLCLDLVTRCLLWYNAPQTGYLPFQTSCFLFNVSPSSFSFLRNWYSLLLCYSISLQYTLQPMWHAQEKIRRVKCLSLKTDDKNGEKLAFICQWYFPKGQCLYLVLWRLLSHSAWLLYIVLL